MKSPPQKSGTTARKAAKAAVVKNVTGSAPRSAMRPPPVPEPSEKSGLQWTFLTNHSHVLVLLARNPSRVLREVAQQVGITERAVQRIIAELEAGGFVKREKIGRQNHYQIRTNQPLRHAIESHRTIGDLLALLNSSQGARSAWEHGDAK